MKPMCIVSAFTTYYWLFIDGFPVVEDGIPTIIGSDQVRISTHPGIVLALHCEALTNQADATLIYWLVNGTFPEDMTSSDRIVELEESTAMQGKILRRDLLLKTVSQEDFKSIFTCVVTNAFGAAQKFTKLTMMAHKRQKEKPLRRRA